MPTTSSDSSPLPPEHEKAAAIRTMFGAIAPRYDLLNHLLSFNLDRRWRRTAADLLVNGLPERGTFLDACAGTLDLSLELAGRPGFRGGIVAVDFALPMLRAGRTKRDGAHVLVTCADAQRLPFADRAFDGAVVGFGVRNLASLDRGLLELARVVRPGGRLVILEFSTPGRQPFRALYLFYFRRILPAIGRLVSRHRSAYAYLPASVLDFPAPPQLGAHLEAAGFGDVRWQAMTGGIVAIHSAIRL